MRKILYSLKGLFIIVFFFSFFSCSSTKIESFEDGRKMIYSETKLKSSDFDNSNFFFLDIKKLNINSKIFEMILNNISTGAAKYHICDDEFNENRKSIAKSGEILYYEKIDEKTNIIVYAIYDKQKLRYIEYTFYLTITEEDYNQYGKVLDMMNSYIDNCNQKIDLCNEIIKTCSNPTIQKSRVVSVPYTVTERYWVAGSSGRRTNSSYGSSTGTSGHYETRERTVYRSETEYYSVPNPNYNPSKVTQAKKDLQYWKNEKDKTQKNLISLAFPFILSPWNSGE